MEEVKGQEMDMLCPESCTTLLLRCSMPTCLLGCGARSSSSSPTPDIRLEAWDPLVEPSPPVEGALTVFLTWRA